MSDNKKNIQMELA